MAVQSTGFFQNFSLSLSLTHAVSLSPRVPSVFPAPSLVYGLCPSIPCTICLPLHIPSASLSLRTVCLPRPLSYTVCVPLYPEPYTSLSTYRLPLSPGVYRLCPSAVVITSFYTICLISSPTICLHFFSYHLPPYLLLPSASISSPTICLPHQSYPFLPYPLVLSASLSCCTVCHSLLSYHLPPFPLVISAYTYPIIP